MADFGNNFSSTAYWQKRYTENRTSGSGSYGRLAAFKADVVNRYAYDRKLSSIVEFGCGDGNQTSYFEFPGYVGVDVSSDVIENAKVRFKDRSDWNFVTTDQYAYSPGSFDMAMSLDVIYHLVEDDVFDAYMTRLTQAASKYILVYASDHDKVGKAKHVRHRAYSHWIEQYAPQWKLHETIENPYPRKPGSDKENTSFAFFRLFERVQ